MALHERRVTILTESDLRRLVGLDRSELVAVESVFPLLSAGAGSIPPIQRIDVPEHRGEIDIKSAYLPGFDGIAVKVSAGFFDNPARGLPSLGGLMLLFDATTGVPLAALFDNGYLTDVRTALAGAVAAEHLAVRTATTVGVLGAGVQARLQVEALKLVRPIERVLVWARRREAAEAFAASVGADAGIAAAAVGAPADAVTPGGIVVTATPSTEPLLGANALRPGVHITAVGADAEHKQELAVDLLTAATRFVCDSTVQSARLGELRAAREAGIDVEVAELGDVIAGRTAGRTSDDDVTVCDLTGSGAQDTAIATLAVARAAAAGAGQTLSTR
jgi:ornithine cyclodeaminase